MDIVYKPMGLNRNSSSNRQIILIDRFFKALEKDMHFIFNLFLKIDPPKFLELDH
jgi:hypothetical protein